MILIASAFIMISILNVPAYVLVKNQLDAFSADYELASTETLMFKQSEQVIKDANEMGKLLQSQQKSVLFSELMTKIQLLASDSVVLSSFSLRREAGVVTQITITGQASSRVTLSNFRDALEQDAYFESAELPLSNLAKDKDIPFSIDIVPAVLDNKTTQ